MVRGMYHGINPKKVMVRGMYHGMLPKKVVVRGMVRGMYHGMRFCIPVRHFIPRQIPVRTPTHT